MGLQNIKQLQKEMQGLLGMQDRIRQKNDQGVGKWNELRQALDAIEQKYDAVFRAGFRLQNLGADLNRMGDAGVAVLKKSVDTWGSFEFALNRAAGALSIWETTTPIYEKLKQGIYEVAQEARIFPAEDIARATYYWGSTTGQVVETEEDLAIVMRGLLPIMKAAAITETDYEQAIKGVYSILVQYGRGLGDAQDVTEKLMLITQRTAAEFPDLINSFKMVGPIASSLGIEFEEVAQYVGMIADAGIRGTMSGRALRQTFVKLVDPTQRAKEALDATFESTYGVGKSFDSLIFPNGEFVGFTKYVDILAGAMEGLNMQEKNQLLGVITTQNELPVLTALVNKQIESRKRNADAIDDEKFSLANAHEQFELTFDLLRNSWQGLVGLWQNSVMPIIHLIGAEVAKLMGPVLTFFSEVAQAVTRFLQQNPVITEWVVKLIALASAALLVAGAFFTVLGTLFVFAAGVGLAIESLKAVVQIFGGFITKLGGGASLIGLFATLMITNFGGARDAVIGLAKTFGEFIDWLGGVMDQANRTFGAFFTIVAAGVGAVGDFFKSLGKMNFRTDTLWDIGIVVGFITEALQSGIGVALGTAAAVVVAVKAFALMKTALLGLRTVWVSLLAMRTAIVGFFMMMAASKTIATGVGILTAALGLLRAALIAAFISNPVGAVIAAVVLGVGLLVIAFRSAGDVINNFAMDFGDMGDKLNEVADETGKSYQQVKDSVQELMREQGLSFEEAIERTRNLGTATADLPARFAAARGGYDEANTSLAALDETTQQTIADMEAMGVEVTPEMIEAMSGIEGAVGGVTEAIEEANWSDTLVGQLAIAAQQSRLEARRIPSEIAAGILEGRNDVINAAKGIGDAVTYELMNEARVGEIRVQMGEASIAIQEAIAAGTPGAVAAAEAQYIALELELAGYLLTIDPKSKEAAGILEKYIKSSDPATQAAAAALYGALEDKALIAKYNIEQYAVDMGIAPENALKLFKASTILQAELMAEGINVPVEELVGQLQTHGEDAITGLGEAIRENAFKAGTATGEVKKEAEANLILLKDIAEQYGIDVTEEFAQGVRDAKVAATAAARHVAERTRVDGFQSQDWYGGGRNVGVAWANGLRSSADWARLMAWEVAAAASEALHGLSPPKEGPLHTIDTGGRNVGIAWSKGLLAAIPAAERNAAALASSVRDNLMMGTASFGTSYESEYRNKIDLNVNVTSSDGSVSDANAQSIADAIQQGLMLDRLEHMVRVS